MSDINWEELAVLEDECPPLREDQLFIWLVSMRILARVPRRMPRRALTEGLWAKAGRLVRTN